MMFASFLLLGNIPETEGSGVKIGINNMSLLLMLKKITPNTCSVLIVSRIVSYDIGNQRDPREHLSWLTVDSGYAKIVERLSVEEAIPRCIGSTAGGVSPLCLTQLRSRELN